MDFGRFIFFFPDCLSDTLCACSRHPSQRSASAAVGGMSHDKKRKTADDADVDDEKEDEYETIFCLFNEDTSAESNALIEEVFPDWKPKDVLTFDRVAVRLPHGTLMRMHYFSRREYFSFNCTVRSVMVTDGGNLEIVITNVGGEEDGERHPEARGANFTVIISAGGELLDVQRTPEFLKLLPSKFSRGCSFPGLESRDHEDEYFRFLLTPGTVTVALVEVLHVGPPPAPPPPSPPAKRLAPF